MTLEDILTIINNFVSNQDLIIKIILIILLSLYGLYSIIVALQVRVLTTIVDQINSSGVLKFIAFLHAVLVIVLLLFTLFFYG